MRNKANRTSTLFLVPIVAGKDKSVVFQSVILATDLGVTKCPRSKGGKSLKIKDQITKSLKV